MGRDSHSFGLGGDALIRSGARAELLGGGSPTDPILVVFLPPPVRIDRLVV